MAAPRALWRILRLLIHLLWGVILSWRHGRSADAHWRAVVRQWLSGVAVILDLRIEQRGDPLCPGALWVSNHVSWLDIVVIGSLSPDPVFLSKDEVRHWPVIGWLARRAGTLFIRRGAGLADARTQIAERLAAGRSVVLFPEGTTTDGRQPRRFFPRLFQAAIDGRAPVQPLALCYPDERGEPNPAIPYIDNMSLMHSLWRIARQRHSRVVVTAIAPIGPDDGAGRDQLAEQAESRVRRALGLDQG